MRRSRTAMLLSALVLSACQQETETAQSQAPAFPEPKEYFAITKCDGLVEEAISNQVSFNRAYGARPMAVLGSIGSVRVDDSRTPYAQIDVEGGLCRLYMDKRHPRDIERARVGEHVKYFCETAVGAYPQSGDGYRPFMVVDVTNCVDATTWCNRYPEYEGEPSCNLIRRYNIKPRE